MLRIGVTGSIGSGKSYICDIFEKRGVPVFYSDQETKMLYHDTDVRRLITSRFGDAVYLGDGTLDRRLLGSMIFGDAGNMKFIEDTLYPALFRRFEAWCRWHDAPFVLFESAILFEKGLASRFDAVLLISAPEDVRIRRVMTRDKCTEAEVRERMRLQWSDERKLPLADHVIIHDGNDNVDEEVDDFIRLMEKRQTHRKPFPSKE